MKSVRNEQKIFSKHIGSVENFHNWWISFFETLIELYSMKNYSVHVSIIFYIQNTEVFADWLSS